MFKDPHDAKHGKQIPFISPKINTAQTVDHVMWQDSYPISSGPVPGVGQEIPANFRHWSKCQVCVSQKCNSGKDWYG